jgi:putative membrane protein insertion efficiency factor
MRRLATAGLIALVRAYQYTLGRILPPACRFQPTCSAYFIDAVRKYGPVRGGWKGLCRIARCHPWSEGGPDPA